MSLGSILKRLTQALPAVLAAAPAVIDAVSEVKKAVRKPKKPAANDADAAVARGSRPEAATIER